ncbi:rhamnose ABC transporter substrate-binding protein [Labrys miyagiensis]|uniref:Rhamnose ABC transporter substrate-binding protein n=1 Tax=Labrys miyagiensis TaxID=346912 RepID=A0ABQ6CK52_9HYPH|nr:substrate-binding domain-containing protein [Labrys miyagiensis]GLS18591.1 rhamnose ABC transporter substrate-binding protein [Labrys miyagiensis]
MSKSLRHILLAGALIAFALPTAVLADDFKLGMVIKSTTNPYYNATLAGAKIAAQETGGEVDNYGPTESSAKAQVDIINSLADRRVTAIAVAPSDPDAVVPAMQRAAKLGAKVVTFDADASGGRSFFVNQATSDSIGRFGAQLLIRELGPDPKGEVAVVSAQPTAANQNLWIEAFKDEVAKYPGLKVVDTVYGYDNEQKAFDATVALTTKHPNLAGIFAPTCPGLPAVARALESVDKGHGKIKLSGNCVPSITSKYMLDGTIGGFYLWDPSKLGYVTYYAAKALVDGKITGKPGDSFVIDKGKWPGTYTIGQDGQIITGKPVEFTKDNYKDFTF